MNSNMNIFEKLDNDSEGIDFEIISRKTDAPQFSTSGNNENASNIFESLNNMKEPDRFGFLDTAKDIGKQIISKGTQGFLGNYGNILEAIGLQSKNISEGENQKYSKEFDILEKSQRGERPSYSDLLELSDTEDFPRTSRLPTSKDISKNIESVTGISQGKTQIGRIAGRGSQFIGEALSLPGGGTKGILSTGVAGLAGQSIREADGPESIATGTEILGSIVPSIVQGKVVARGGEAKQIQDAGRAINLTEKQIAPLVNSENKIQTLSKIARKGTRTKDSFASIKESLGDSYQNIKQSVSSLGNVNAANQKVLIDKFTNIRNDLSTTLKASPDKEAAIKFIDEAIDKVSKSGASPEELINFWQDINKSVRWNSIQGGKKSLTRLKEPITAVLNNVAPQAAKDFELTNKLYSKYSQISKKLKPDLVDSFLNKGELVSIVPAGVAMATGNPWPLVSLGTESAVRTLASEMLINPYFQSLGNKLVTNFNQGSVKAVTELVKNTKEMMERKYPEEDWSFLTQQD